jgi:hypothetical protein
MHGPEEWRTLARYPYPIVRVGCRYCRRRGQYRLERLIDMYGRDATFDEVLTHLSADCTRASDRTSRPGGCRGAYLPDLERRCGGGQRKAESRCRQDCSIGTAALRPSIPRNQLVRWRPRRARAIHKTMGQTALLSAARVSSLLLPVE